MRSQFLHEICVVKLSKYLKFNWKRVDFPLFLPRVVCLILYVPLWRVLFYSRALLWSVVVVDVCWLVVELTEKHRGIWNQSEFRRFALNIKIPVL